MPTHPRAVRPPRIAGRALVGLALFLPAPLAVIPVAGCSRHPVDEQPQEDDDEDAGALSALDASRLDAADAADARDARSDEELAAITDAGRFCGEKGLPDCPLQLWMKRNATTILTFGETTTLAEVFDTIARLAPPKGLTPQTFANWASIAHDGAAASRMGNLHAARAACRGCHSEYLGAYHADFRGLAVTPPPGPHR